MIVNAENCLWHYCFKHLISWRRGHYPQVGFLISYKVGIIISVFVVFDLENLVC